MTILLQQKIRIAKSDYWQYEALIKLISDAYLQDRNDTRGFP
jgi:hypothetical protein